MKERHYTDGINGPTSDGWCAARCVCGFATGPMPGFEDVVDALMDHAFGAGKSVPSSSPKREEEG